MHAHTLCSILISPNDGKKMDSLRWVGRTKVGVFAVLIFSFALHTLYFRSLSAFLCPPGDLYLIPLLGLIPCWFG